MTGYQTYQGNQVNGASPLGLILLTYEALYKSLGRTRYAIQAGDLSAEADHTSRCMEALIELSSSLDVQKGGRVAQSLASLYVYMMDRLTNGLCSCSTEHIDEVIKLTQELREGWMNLSQQQSKVEYPTLLRSAA